MEKFYFTYGTSGQPFVGGWTEVEAPNRKFACDTFRWFHPDKIQGILNCSSVYTEQEFKLTQMYAEGNFDKRCHEVIKLTRELMDNKEVH